MTAREQFRIAYRGLRALEGLPSRTRDLRENWPNPRHIDAYLATRDIPDVVMEGARWCLGNAGRQSTSWPMIPTNELARMRPHSWMTSRLVAFRQRRLVHA